MSTKTAGGLVAGAAGNSGGRPVKIKLLRGKVVNGDTQKEGAVLEVADKDARHLIATSAAVEVGGKKADGEK